MKEDVRFRLFSADGHFIASCADPPLMVAALGHGATIRDNLFRKDVLWTEGSERHAADANFKYAIDTLMQRRLIRRARVHIEASHPLPFD